MADLYSTIMHLCEGKGVTGYKLCKEIGIRPSIITDLKSGRKKSLSAETANKIASYFMVPVGFLLAHPPFTFWEDINTNRKSFFQHININHDVLFHFWQIDPNNPAASTEKQIIDFLASEIKEAIPTGDDEWLIVYATENNCSAYILPSYANSKPTVPEDDGLSDHHRLLIEFAKSLSEEQAALALRLLKSLVEEN